MLYAFAVLSLIFSALPLAAADFPCSLIDFRVMKIAARDSLFVRCSNIHVTKVDFPGELFEMNGGIQTASQKAQIVQSDFPGWLVVQLEKPLEKKKTYLLRFAGDGPPGQVEVGGNAVPGPFDLVKYSFTTKPTAQIVRRPVSKPADLEFILASPIGMNLADLSKISLKEELGGVPRLLEARFELIQSAVAGDPASLTQLRMNVIGSGPRSLDSKLSVEGVTNLFGDPLEIDPKKRAAIPGAPKTKDDADLYLQLLNQAGPGSKPGWAADVKFAPSLLKSAGGYYLSPQILANIGWGTVADTKVSDSIKAGLGFTRFYRNPGVQFSPRGEFETNRKGTKQNLLFDVDSQWFLPNLRKSIKDRNMQTWAIALQTNGDLELGDVHSVPFGYQVQLFMGSEVGAPRTANKVAASEGDQFAVVPTYTIARLRPRLAVALEYRRVSLTLTATPRYLLAGEIVTKERRVTDPADLTKQIVYVDLHKAKGLRAYGEASVSYQLDAIGHFAFTSTYKLGSEPPNFDYVNTVQTGFVVRF